MSATMRSVDDVKALIRAGKPLMLAGDEALLRQLPAGDWIAGTIPYFLDEAGGLCTRDAVQVTPLPDLVTGVRIERYDQARLPRIYAEGADAGYSIIILPGLSPIHLAFGLDAPTYEQFGVRPLVGWVSGVHLGDIGKVTPKVFDGRTGEAIEDAAVVMRVSLPAGKVADAGIVNIFEPGDGPTFVFDQDGFSARDVRVDGEPTNFARYAQEHGLDTRLPLVADYAGARINVSFQAVDAAAGEVKFYAPVVKGVEYRHARPIDDYVSAFTRALPGGQVEGLAFACNCVLNFVHSELEGKKTGPITGPVTFGEVAYQLLNQTLAYVKVEDAAR